MMQLIDIASFFYFDKLVAIPTNACRHGNTSMAHQIMNRAFQVIGFLVLMAALAAPAVHAATGKRQVVKTQRTASKAKAPVSSKTQAKPIAVRKMVMAKKGIASKKITASKTERVSKKGAVLRKSIRFTARVQKRPVVYAAIPAKQSFGQLAGLHEAQDALELKSSVALVVDQDTREILFSKNDHAVLPIASLTKLMTGYVISNAKLPMDEMITITQADVDTEKGSSSRLRVGATLSRGELLHLALMSSENRAAHALGRTYPGGLSKFVTQMNLTAKMLAMHDTRYVEPTGLSSLNQSSAQDLATLVNVAHGDPLLRELSTSAGHQVAVGRQTLQYNNTNQLVKSPAWEIGLQKTGYISEAGQCLVMQAKIAGRKLIMVFLDSADKFSRLRDAERVRRWVESNPVLDQKMRISASVPHTNG